MTAIHLTEASSVADRIQRDVPHALGLGISAKEHGIWSAAVVDSHSGEVLAWDGWYSPIPAQSAVIRDVPLSSLDWDDWDDMPSKLLARANARWLVELLSNGLVPSYSFARMAADIIFMHADSPVDAQSYHDSELAAYFPVIEVMGLLDSLDERKTLLGQPDSPGLLRARAMIDHALKNLDLPRE